MKRVLGLPVCPRPPREVFPYIQPSWQSEAIVSRIQESLATVQANMVHGPCDVVFASMQKARAIGSQRIQPRFQRKAWEARQCVAMLGFLQAAPEGAIGEAGRVKPKMQLRPQEP